MRAAVLFAVILATASTAPAADPVKPPAGFDVRTLKGFTILVHEAVLRQPADRWGRRPLDVLEAEFDDLKRVVPARHLELLRQVPVFVSWDAVPANSGIVAVYRSSLKGAKHVGGEDAPKINCIEILTLKRLGELRPPGSVFQQVVTLHEMAHAVHHRLLGWDAPEVKNAFNQAVERKLYDDSWDRSHRRGRAYARTNEAEYFAELTCAYLDSCHYYPFTYSELREHDPIGFALMDAVWKKPEQFAGRVAAVPTPRFELPRQTAYAGVAPGGPAAERAAFAQLDRARALQRDGKADEARKVLDAVVKTFPSTIAAGDARRMLSNLR
jgi:hypothetical protein